MDDKKENSGTVDKIIELVAEAMGDEDNILFNPDHQMGVVLDSRPLNAGRRNPLDIHSCNISCMEGDNHLWLITDIRVLTSAMVRNARAAANSDEAVDVVTDGSVPDSQLTLDFDTENTEV